MTLALLVDVDKGRGGENRLTALVGAVMTMVLLLAAAERIQEGPAAQSWLPLACALACALWAFHAWRRSALRPAVRLQVLQGGGWRLSALDSGESREAILVRGWSLGGLIALHLRRTDPIEPAAAAQARPKWRLRGGSTDCRFLLSRRSFDETQWHALRRYLVWQRRSRSTRMPGA
jgi:hypothetical protein